MDLKRRELLTAGLPALAASVLASNIGKAARGLSQSWFDRWPGYPRTART